MAQVTSHVGTSVRAFEAPKTTGILYILTALVFVIFSFWNGLYFDTSFMTTAIYCTVLLIIGLIWFKVNRLKIIGWQIADYLVFSYYAVYFLSTLWPANWEYAVLGFVRGVSYAFFYLLLRFLTSVDDRKQLMINSLIFSGVAFALFGLANGFGTLKIDGAINGSMRRLGGNFEYANTFAIYEAIVFLLSVVMASYVAERSKRKFIYEVSAFLSVVSLILTYSRGTWLVLVGMILLLILMSPKENKGRVTLYTLLPILVTLGTLSFFTNAVQGQKQILGWSTLSLGIVGVLLITWAINLLKKRLTLRQWRIFALVSWALLFVGASFIILKHGLPQKFVQRIATINFQQLSVLQRFQFYKDGLKILTEHPFLGAGPSAWEALWQRYQSYPYISRQSHSFLIDVIMSVGIIGFILFISMLLFTIFLAIRVNRKEHARSRLLNDALLISLSGLIAHGAIDFDFSFGTINFLMWTFIALSLPKITIQQESILARGIETPTFQRILTITGITLSLIGSVIAVGYIISDLYLQKAVTDSKDPTVAMKAAQNAVYLAPYRASAWLTAAQFEDTVYKQKNNADFKKMIIDSASNAVALSPHDPDILSKAAVLIGNYGDGLKAFDVMRQAWENSRYHIEYSEQYMSYSEMLGTNIYAKDKSDAKKYFSATLDAYHDVENRISDLKKLPSVLKPEYSYKLTPSMHLKAGEAAYYLGEWKEAQRIVKPILTMKNVQNTDLLKAKALMAAIQEKLGKTTDVAFLKEIKKDKQVMGYYEGLKKVK
jgi:O-antigen ligase